jgi:aminoglycoside phosphotransferase (APT) family kinase protein
VPRRVREGIERRLGSPVLEAITQRGGFSPGLAVRLRTAAGAGVFVKAVSGATNAHSPALHRREARIAAQLPATAPAPRLHWSYEDGDWVVLAFDEINGTMPRMPWQRDELNRVLDTLGELADALTPSPIAIESAAELHAESFAQWRVLATQDDERSRLEPGWRARLDALVKLEEQWPAACAGDTLVHFDVRADNILLTPTRAYVVDWPWAALGAPWLDLALMLPSVAMQGGPPPEMVWREHALARDVDAEALDAFLAAFAGFLTRMSLLPEPPGLPTLRAFQASQAAIARRWLAQRRRWRDPEE